MEELTDKTALLNGLYKDQTLYKVEDSLPAISYEGGNARHIVLVFNNPNPSTESRLEKEVLNRMFSRLNTSFDDIALVNIAVNEGLAFNQLNKKLSPKVFVSFGLPPKSFNLNMEVALYQTLTMGSIKLLFCDDLLTIDKNNDLKKKFWAQFSPLFVVNE